MPAPPLQDAPRLDIEADEHSPLAVAMSTSERATIDMVRDALKSKRMRLAFQPAVYAADTSIIGFYEGYIRLLDDRQVPIPAREFMPLAEGREIGREIDVAALDLGLTTLLANPGVRIAINMSARSIGYKPWTQLLRQRLREHPELGKGLILEINEESVIQMADVLGPFMDELREFGIAFTLDDFGDGLTSLSLLHDLAFDIAKLDARFIRGCETDQRVQPIVRAAIAMAREFDMFLVAESVETTAEALWLRDQGVGCFQGYLFGRPELEPDFKRFLAARP